MNNYRRGRAKEYQTQRLLEASGYFTVRSAGSHSPVDILAFSSLGARLIQVKLGSANVSPHEREVLKNLPRPANCTVEIWRWKDRVREPMIERVG
jgi:Holliday junction resolvase